MQQHVRVLAWLHIAYSSLGVLAAFIVLAIFGGIAGIVRTAADASDAQVAVPILAIIGLFIMVIVLLVSIPGLIAGVGLLSLQPWARVLTIVISALELLSVPLGTALGVYGLWVLLSNEGTALFANRT